MEILGVSLRWYDFVGVAVVALLLTDLTVGGVLWLFAAIPISALLCFVVCGTIDDAFFGAITASVVIAAAFGMAAAFEMVSLILR